MQKDVIKSVKIHVDLCFSVILIIKFIEKINCVQKKIKGSTMQ